MSMLVPTPQVPVARLPQSPLVTTKNISLEHKIAYR